VATDEPVPEITEPDDLYSLPLDQFTRSRDLLARWLRSEDRGDEAEEVGKLRKPSVAALALNLASRNKPELVDRLMESHRMLRKADSMNDLQSATERRRQAVSALTEAAMGELRAQGRPDSAQTRERISETLLATATDADAEARLAAGTLTKELEPTGSGWGQMGLPPIEVDPRQEAVTAAEQARARADRLAKDTADAERQLEIAEKSVKDARRRAKQLRAESEEASAEADRAEKAADET
jgi:hypothetical protein